MKNSKTAQAVAWIVAEPGRTQYRAAQLFDVSQSAISVALWKREEDGLLWDDYGERIAAGDTHGIPHKTILRALRGRDTLRDNLKRVPPLSRTQQALDHAAGRQCSLADAARLFDVDAGTLYAAQSKERALMLEYAKLHVDPLHSCASPAEFADKYGIENQGQAIKFFNLQCALVRREKIRKERYAEECEAGVRIGRGGMRMQAATIARAMGGDAGEAIAQAIESIQ